MVGFNSVSKWYTNQRKILDGIHFNLKKGDFLYIIGGSGAGKTTLLKLVSGHIQPSLGAIHLFGFNLDLANEPTMKAIRRCIAVIPQNIQLIPELSVFDNVALSLTLARNQFLKKEFKDHIMDLLHRLGLSDKAKDAAAGLSGGELQRVAVARALIRSPELIVADEPTGSQDRENTWAITELLLKANQAGSTIILATHDREIVRRVRKRSAILRNGKMFFEDPLCIY